MIKFIIALFKKEQAKAYTFPYDRPAGLVIWPENDNFEFADSILAADRSLQLTVDPWHKEK